MCINDKPTLRLETTNQPTTYTTNNKKSLKLSLPADSIPHTVNSHLIARVLTNSHANCVLLILGVKFSVG